MTSNLGAERFRRSRLGFGRSNGHDDSEAEQKYFRAAQKHFTQAVQDFLRPEILNRIDHIMPFLPLARDTVERIAERELSLIEQRDGIRLRGVTVRVEKPVIESLARRGYDSQYGARPLKRLVERELLLPLSKQLNSRPPDRKADRLIAGVRLEGSHLRVHLEEQTRKRRETAYDDSNQAARVNRLGDIRRRVQRLARSSAVIELHNSISRLKQIEQRIARAARRAKVTRRQAGVLHTQQNPLEASALTHLVTYQKIAGELKRLEEATATAEDEALLVLYGAAAQQNQAVSNASQLATDLRHLLNQLLDLRYSHPHRITLAIYSENQRSLFALARGYFTAAVSAMTTIKIAYYTANIPPEREEEIIGMFDRKVARVEAPGQAGFLLTAPENTTGIILGFEGQSAYATYEGEHGLHALIEEKAVHNLFVHTSETSFQEYKAPPSLERRGSINPASHGERRRTYHRTDGYIEDRILDERREWPGYSVDAMRRLSAVLKELIEMQYERTAEKLITE